MGEVKTFKKGEVIFKEGELQIFMYDIKEGKVDIIAAYGKENETKLTELEAGQFFGEMALLEVLPRSATAVAASDCQLAEIRGDEFGDYFRDDPEKLLVIFKNLNNRINALSDEYVKVCADITEYVGQDPKAAKKGLWERIKEIMAKADDMENPGTTFKDAQGNKIAVNKL